MDQQETPQQEKSLKATAIPPLSLPYAVILGSVIIAITIGITGGFGDTSKSAPSPSAQGANPAQPQAGQNDSVALDNVRPVTKEDHIRGNIKAQVKIVEYSDMECPFCKQLHNTLKQIMSEYESGGKVAWAYRHFPIDQLHSKARKQAEATECAAGLGGNDVFWKYIDRIYEITPSGNGLDMTELQKTATLVGLSLPAFNECLDSGRYAQNVIDDQTNAGQTGGRGTPWSIVIAKNGKKFPVNGAMPYESIKQIVEQALAEK